MRFISAFFFSLLVFGLSAKAQTNTPNVLIIIADDLGVDPLNAYHDARRTATTPTIDSLVSEGVLFENIFAPPLCTPSRAAMLTGKYGVKTGVLGVPGTLDTIHHTLFREIERLQPNTYANAVIGKWHLKARADVDDPARHGVQFFDGVIGGAVPDYFEWERTTNGSQAMEDAYATTAFTDAAIDWIGNQNKPWFMWLAHVAPHTPYQVPPAGLFTTSNTNTDLGKYISMIEALDAETGRLLSSLSPTQKANTVVIFVGDNGTPSGVLQDYPRGHGKASLYQGGVRVPFIISGAGVTRKGDREAALVHSADIFSTVLNITGSVLNTGSENSRNLVPYLNGNQIPERVYNYSEIGGQAQNGWTMRSDQYKLIAFDDGTQEFYDLVADSLEANNLLPQGLTQAQLDVKADFEAEAMQQRDDYSCRDFIQNGNEEGIDCGGTFCAPCTVSIQEAIDIDIQLSPNPAADYVRMQAVGHIIKYVEIFDLNGRLLRRTTGVNSPEANVSLDDLSPQTLFVRLRVGEHLIVRQIVKQ